MSNEEQPLQLETNSLNPDAPEHLRIKSRDYLDQLLQAGLESGNPIEVTDDWWEQKHTQLFNSPSQTP